MRGREYEKFIDKVKFQKELEGEKKGNALNRQAE